MRSIAVIFVTLTLIQLEEALKKHMSKGISLLSLWLCFCGYLVASSSLTEHIELVHES